MKRFLSSLCLTSYVLAIAHLTPVQAKPASPRSVQLNQIAPAPGDLYYTFYGQQIPLALRQDMVAVAFKPVPTGTRGEFEPLYQQLQRDLQANHSRGLNSNSP